MGDPPPGTANRFGVGLEGVDIVQVRLPVLDKPSVIRRYHPHSIMTPLHTAHWSVVSLGQHDIIMIINSQKRILFWGKLGQFKLLFWGHFSTGAATPSNGPFCV